MSEKSPNAPVHEHLTAALDAMGRPCAHQTPAAEHTAVSHQRYRQSTPRGLSRADPGNLATSDGPRWSASEKRRTRAP